MWEIFSGICGFFVRENIGKFFGKMWRMKSFQRFQPLPLEDQHVEYANGDGRVSEVEDGAEEDEMPVGTEEELGQPRGVFYSATGRTGSASP